MSVDSMEKLFVHELRDLYSAETQIAKTLPKLAKAARLDELRCAFEDHLNEAEAHVRRLEQIFEMIGESPKGRTCDGIKGVLGEGSKMLRKTKDGPVRDEALISTAQRVEHYEMAAYGTARSHADRMGQKQMAELLDKTLDEEKKADKRLTEISNSVHRQMRRAA
jgi:ferritin-like metal-binding protein YciE